MTTVQVPKYFLILAVIFITILLTPIVVAYHIIKLGPFLASGGALIFPIAYIVIDIIAEIYGYRLARHLIWCEVLAKLLLATLITILINIQSPVYWHNQEAYNTVFHHVIRFAIASSIGTTAGALVNIYFFSKWKLLCKGKHFLLRSMGATLLGDLILTIIVYPITFFHVSQYSHIFAYMVSATIFKLIYIILGTPIAALVVKFLKITEKHYIEPANINYNPFIFFSKKND